MTVPVSHVPMVELAKTVCTTSSVFVLMVIILLPLYLWTVVRGISMLRFLFSSFLNQQYPAVDL